MNVAQARTHGATPEELAEALGVDAGAAPIYSAKTLETFAASSTA